MPVPTDHNVIMYRDAKWRRRFNDLSGNGDVVRAWGRVSARVVVQHRGSGISRNTLKPLGRSYSITLVP